MSLQVCVNATALNLCSQDMVYVVSSLYGSPSVVTVAFRVLVTWNLHTGPQSSETPVCPLDRMRHNQRFEH